jgi:hypothetical protein
LPAAGSRGQVRFPPLRRCGYDAGMSEPRKKPLWPWIVALLIGLPVLYVVSSGPARTLLVEKRLVIPTGPPGTQLWIGPTVVVESGRWKTLYLPLDLIAAQKIGALLRWYWDWFPLDAKPRLP